jgi:hypothetical protein
MTSAPPPCRVTATAAAASRSGWRAGWRAASWPSPACCVSYSWWENCSGDTTQAERECCDSERIQTYGTGTKNTYRYLYRFKKWPDDPVGYRYLVPVPVHPYFQESRWEADSLILSQCWPVGDPFLDLFWWIRSKHPDPRAGSDLLNDILQLLEKVPVIFSH